uniref:Protein LSM12 homolog n=2 Tax=Schistocephalus solidus TaxID=70667 RepID=A0A0X3NHX3_SCHSO
MYRQDLIKNVKPSNNTPITNYPDLDLEKITARTLRNEKIQREHLKLYEPGVPKDARELFEHFYKTLPTPPRWEKPNIQVFEQTIIKPPYTANSVTSSNESGKAKWERDYVQKLVEKFYGERNPGS